MKKTQPFYYDIINGTDCPMTWDEVLDQVRDNPCATDMTTQFFYDDEGSSWSIGDIMDIIGDIK